MTIFLQTQNASSTNTSSGWTWILGQPLDWPPGTQVQVGVSHFWMYNLFQTVSTGVNDTLVTSLGTFTIPAGAYSGSDLAAELQILINTVDTSVSVEYDYTVLGFQFYGDTFTLYGSSSGTTCFTLLGFSDASHSTSSSTDVLKSDNIANLAAPVGINVDTSIFVMNVDSNKGSTLGTTRLCNIPVTGQYGDTMSYNPAPVIYAISYDHFIPHITITLSNSTTGAQLSLKNTNVTIVLSLIINPPDQIPPSVRALSKQFFDNQSVNSANGITSS